MTDSFGFERNHYDRMAHFTVGFYAYPMAELLVSRRLINARWIAYAFPFSAILAIAGLYELFEWQFAVLGDPGRGPRRARQSGRHVGRPEGHPGRCPRRGLRARRLRVVEPRARKRSFPS